MSLCVSLEMVHESLHTSLARESVPLCMSHCRRGISVVPCNMRGVKICIVMSGGEALVSSSTHVGG
jgi:hypothetical protein